MLDTRLHPFATNPECPKCGAHNLHNADTEFGYKEIVEAGKGGSIPITSFQVAWCAGGKPIEETKEVPTFMGNATVKAEYTCPGVTEEHLHVRCGRCYYSYLMLTRDGAERANAANA